MDSHHGNGGLKCSSCGGTGRSHKERQELAEKNRQIETKRLSVLNAEIQELELAPEQFEIKTNLDAIVKSAAEERLQTLKWRR